MKTNKYPRLGSTGFNPKGQSKCKCAACDEPSRGYLWVQFTYMRGDDEKYMVCKFHHTLAKESIRRFLDHVERKEEKLDHKTT